MSAYRTEEQALADLRMWDKFKIEGGVISLKPGRTEYDINPTELRAIDYLCTEWDYSTRI